MATRTFFFARQLIGLWQTLRNNGSLARGSKNVETFFFFLVQLKEPAGKKALAHIADKRSL